MSIDALVKAQTTLEWCFQASPDGPYEIGAKLSIDWRMRRAELAVQVALAERMDKLIEQNQQKIDTSRRIDMLHKIESAVYRCEYHLNSIKMAQ